MSDFKPGAYYFWNAGVARKRGREVGTAAGPTRQGCPTDGRERALANLNSHWASKKPVFFRQEPAKCGPCHFIRAKYRKSFHCLYSPHREACPCLDGPAYDIDHD